MCGEQKKEGILMKKLFSKLITTAVAVTMAVQGVNVFAFSDMQDTESVILTQKLGITSGYEDGTYRPDNTITRAEAVKILTAAVGLDDNAVEEYRGDENKFSDIDENYWAADYIKAGALNGIIEGFDDGTFRPDDNVTVEQLLTMIVSMVGYKTYAQAQGGYPQGYIKYGKSFGIADKLRLNGSDYQRYATRGEILEMIASSLTIPLCVVDSYEVAWNGISMPILQIKDGSGRDYQSLLTSFFNVFTVNATVKDIKNESLSLEITSSVNFADELITSSRSAVVKLGDNDKNSFEKNKNYKMYIIINDEEEKDYELLSGFLIE